jgi:transposase
MQQETIFIGADVAKAEIVMAVHGMAQRPVAIPNNAQAIADWLQRLPANVVIAMESTGRHHGLFARMARAAGFAVYVLNARDVHYYAKALGTRAKTDAVDSIVIARYIAEHRAILHEWAPGDTLQSQVTELLLRRARVATLRSALRQAMNGVTAVQEAFKSVDEQLECLMAAIDAQVQRLIAQDTQMAAGCARLQTITGIGPQASALLGALFSRIKFANSDALVAYCGLDPRPQDSGARKGRRKLSKKGPPALRRQLYLTGLTAGKSNALKAQYLALKERGFKTTEAVIILARKLLRVAFAIWKSDQPFDASRILPQPP